MKTPVKGSVTVSRSRRLIRITSMVVCNEKVAVSHTKHAPRKNTPGTMRSGGFEWLFQKAPA